MNISEEFPNSLGIRSGIESSNSIDCDLKFKLIDKYNKEYNLDKNLIGVVKKILKEGKIIVMEQITKQYQI